MGTMALDNNTKEDGLSSQQGDGTLDISPAEKDGLPGEASPDQPLAQEAEYITGWKLFVVVGACTMATFLMLLDVSIVATVTRNHFPNAEPHTDMNLPRPYLKSLITFIHCLTSGGTAQHICLRGK